MMQKLQPKLLHTLKGYTRDQIIKDATSGVMVAIIALPLSIALALASGVKPEQGLYTAIIAGFLISLSLGGSRVQIAGPYRGLCYDCRRDCRPAWDGWAHDRHNHGWFNLGDDGGIPVGLADPLHPLYDHRRFYCGHRRQYFRRTAQGFSRH